MNAWMGDCNRGVAILRVSSDRQKDSISHAAQRRSIENYCELNGIVLVRVHEITESAKDSELRKKYAAAIAGALAEKHRHILFYMYDREARNLTDNEQNEKYAKADLIALHYVAEGKVLYKDTPHGEWFTRDVLASANKEYSRALSYKINDAMQKKAEDGWFPSNHVPLGYKTQKRKDAQGNEFRRGVIIGVTDNEDELALVRMEFALRAKGLSYPEIRRQILKAGIVPAGERDGYGVGAIEYRLKNPFYEGDFMWKGVRYKGKHPLIISPEIIAAVRRQERGKRGLRLVTDSNIFAGGWIKCGICGCEVTTERHTKKYRNGTTGTFSLYRCANGKRVHKSFAGMYVSEARLWEQFDAVVAAITITESEARAIAAALNDAERKATDESRRKIVLLQAQIDAIKRREDAALEKMLDQEIDAEMFRRHRNSSREQLSALTQELDAAKSQAAGRFRENMASVIELAKSALSLYKSRTPLEKREFLENIVSNPRLEGGSIRYDLKEAWGALGEIIKKSEMVDRPWGLSNRQAGQDSP
jgi:DNA invertase Pin-like site-specific DNA recombinase